MYWLRFSKIVQYLTTFIMHLISVTLTYNIFFSPHSTAYLYEGLSTIAVYHRNASNRYWFVFSSLISILLLACTIAYYSFTYGLILYGAIQKYSKSTEKNKSFFNFLLSEDFYSMQLVDFGFVALSISWNIIWAIHLVLQLIQCSLGNTSLDNTVSYEQASVLLLLSTQITLIALRYPSLFQEVGTMTIYGLLENVQVTAPEKDIVREVGTQFVRAHLEKQLGK